MEIAHEGKPGPHEVPVLRCEWGKGHDTDKKRDLSFYARIGESFPCQQKVVHFS
jgi:hypothetical protein